MKRTLFQSLLALLVLDLAQVTTSQTETAAARPDRGLTTGAAYSVSDLENISLTNGNGRR